MLLCATGRSLTGVEALALGLVTELADDPVAAAREHARAGARRNPDAVRSVVRLVRAAQGWPDQDA